MPLVCVRGCVVVYVFVYVRVCVCERARACAVYGKMIQEGYERTSWIREARRENERFEKLSRMSFWAMDSIYCMLSFPITHTHLLTQIHSYTALHTAISTKAYQHMHIHQHIHTYICINMYVYIKLRQSHTRMRARTAYTKFVECWKIELRLRMFYVLIPWQTYSVRINPSKAPV